MQDIIEQPTQTQVPEHAVGREDMDEGVATTELVVVHPKDYDKVPFSVFEMVD